MLILLVLCFLIIGIIIGYMISYFKEKNYKLLLINYTEELKVEKISLATNLSQKQDQVLNLSNQLIAYKMEVDNHLARIKEQKQDIITMKNQFTHEFENLANRIFFDASNKFSEQNRVNLGNLLTPLGEKIKDFEGKVNDVYEKENKERIGLRVQIEELSKLNQQMNQETHNLTKALKGDTKIQGNWGEMILEKILDKSGLSKGNEYTVQTSFVGNEGERYRPDVIINLPDNKALVIDSKVSLTAYERLISYQDSNEYNKLLKEHVQSIKNHIKNLNSKSYQSLYKLNSLDFVLMFVPIESAFSLALQADNTLFDEALHKNIIIVCPSTLLATVRTIYTIWRSEKSMQNSKEIAKIGGELYDRLVGFLVDLEKINDKISQTKECYDSALTKLQGNKGVVKSAIKLKELGSNSTKVLNPIWIERL
ncbi:MAG: DNA recombination protein RmuC [Proteobacteria bacterium]|nr:DNA recombination protein RmuC [Pseudomonadota bacterium]